MNKFKSAAIVFFSVFFSLFFVQAAFAVFGIEEHALLLTICVILSASLSNQLTLKLFKVNSSDNQL
jgi:hypothetical protein